MQVQCILYLPAIAQVADALRKGLPKKQFDKSSKMLAMEDDFKPT